jgi:hypothetical protein
MAADRDTALRVFSRAITLRDSLFVDTTPVSFTDAAYLTLSLGSIGDFYSRGLFADSARFHRMVDQVAITMDQVHGTITYVNGHAYPSKTPYLAWKLYDNLGVYFQPVETAQQVAYIVTQVASPTDSVIAIAEHLYRYALWRTHRGVRYPVWEYEFPWTSGGVSVNAPWVSGLAQAAIMVLFAECYRRTGNSLWRDRAMSVFHSLLIPWDEGGVLLPDTTHGYWFEEFHPTVQVWNGGAQALLGVGFLATVTGDSAVKRVYQSGLAAMKYYTPFYDTGAWTRYSRTQGLNSLFYHQFCIQIADALYTQTADTWFKDLADRWRSYSPPSGVQTMGSQ